MPPRPGDAASARGLSYRPATEADRPFLEALYASTRAEELAASGWPPEVQRQFFKQQFAARHGQYRHAYPAAHWLIVEARGAVIGRLSIDETAGRIHLIDIALMPEQTGGGLGSAILSDLIDEARRDSKILSLSVEANSRALKLYRALGFVETETDGMHARMEWRTP